MSGDELATTLFAERGELIVGSDEEMEIGALYSASSAVQMQQDFYPIAKARLEDWEAQQMAIEHILGRRMEGSFQHYYRVELAVDTIVPLSLLVTRIEAAVLAERERCAKIAEQEALIWYDTNAYSSGHRAGRFIADAIRSGK